MIQQIILGFLFVLYILFSPSLPNGLAQAIDSLPGMISILFIFGSLFAFVHPLLGVLGLVVAILLIQRSKQTFGSIYVPTEEKRAQNMRALNAPYLTPFTLEQEIVSKMVPDRSVIGLGIDTSSYQPILDDTYNAESLY